MDPLGQIAEVSRRSLENRHLPWCLALLSMLLCVRALSVGWVGDDNYHRVVLTRPDIPNIPHDATRMFVFIEGDETANRQTMALGFLPWWASERLKLAFYRPLTSLTHWLDYRLWPEKPWLMHLQSLIWFGGVVAVATLFFRRMLSCAWVAGLAALLFAVDDAHMLPAVWLANRNALLGVFFGLLTLMMHDRWRRDRSWAAAALAPPLLLTAVLSKEGAVATGAYLLAYALFLDRGTRASRFLSLVPCVVVGLAWWLWYRQQGYGVAGSGWYIDPAAEPMRFLPLVAERAPLLLAWQWLVPTDLEWNLSPPVARALWLASMGLLLLIAAVLVPLVRRDRTARFFALGMVLSVVPACTVYPSGRMLFFAGIGGMGLLAQLMAGVIDQLRNRSGVPTTAWRRWPVRALCAFFVVIHLVLGPLALARAAGSHQRWGRTAARTAESLPTGAGAMLQTVVFANMPTYAVFAYSVLEKILTDRPYMSRSLVLGSGVYPIELHREDRRTMVVRFDERFLASPGDDSAGREMERLLFDHRELFRSLNRLYRDDAPMTVGQKVEMIGVTAEVAAVTDDGRPSEVAFRFMIDPSGPLLRWLQWQDGAFVPLGLSVAGETMTLPAATLRFE